MEGSGGKLGLGRVVSQLGVLVVLSEEASVVVLSMLSEVVSADITSVMISYGIVVNILLSVKLMLRLSEVVSERMVVLSRSSSKVKSLLMVSKGMESGKVAGVVLSASVEVVPEEDLEGLGDLEGLEYFEGLEGLKGAACPVSRSVTGR